MSHSHSHSTSQDGQQQQQHGGGLFARLRGQAEAALANVPQINEVQHYIRQASVQANPRQPKDTLQHQLAVKGLKGVIIDHDAVARETKNYSKNVLDFVRGENSPADIQDVGDRLAFLTYKAGELHDVHAKQLESARIALKDIRNFEANLGPQREQRAFFEREIGKLRTSAKPDTSTTKKIESLQSELDILNSPDSQLSRSEVEAIILKRTKLAECFNSHFESLQELGEKLAIVAGYGKALVKDWDVNPSTAGKNEYADGARTASVRQGVEQALSTYNVKKPMIPLPDLGQARNSGAGPGTASGGFVHAPSFHESHASELASLHSVEDPVAAHKEALDSYYNGPPSPTSTSAPAAAAAPSSTTPGVAASGISQYHASTAAVPIPGAAAAATPTASSSAGYGTTAASPFVQQLNNAPVTGLPPPAMSPSTGAATSTPVTGTSADTMADIAHSPSTMPTVAETGAPITGTGGPAKGVLKAPEHRSESINSAQSKQEEARAELNRRFDEYSGHDNNGQGGGEGTSASGYGQERFLSGEGADLEREMSLRARRGEETLPAYTQGGSNISPAVPEKDTL